MAPHLQGHLPDVIVIGATKCGTTSLHHYLGLHPQIGMSAFKEPDFFVLERNWNRGLDWYRSQFQGEAPVHGEVSPKYTAYPEFQGVPERLSQVVPHAKLIYLMRDPINRMVSHYMHRVALRAESRTFEGAAAAAQPVPCCPAVSDRVQDRPGGFAEHLRVVSYRAIGLYHMQIQRYLQFFPLSRILFVTTEELQREPRQTMQTIFRFLAVDETFFSPQFIVRRNRAESNRCKNRFGTMLSGLNDVALVQRLPQGLREWVGRYVYLPFSSRVPKPSISESLRQNLVSVYHEDINRLRALTGRSFPEWSV
jgi:hypothetical protein